jgi:hypothetical protein
VTTVPDDGPATAAARGVVLYARSRALHLTLAALAGTAVFAVWAAGLMNAYLDTNRRIPLVALAPLLAASVIGVSLHTWTDELDRTAVLPWWPRRLAHLAGLTALAAALLPLAVLGHPLAFAHASAMGHASAFGPPVMIRNLLGCTGMTAAAAALLGARLSWLPAFGHVSAVYLASGGVRGPAVTVWAWPVQPDGRLGAWLAAGAAFVLGSALYTARGARAEEARH